MNEVFVHSLQPDDLEISGALFDAELILTQLFGTPDHPRLPSVIKDGSIVSLERIERAAGSVSSDRSGKDHGLFRKHCAHCHGLTGDGCGPASSLLNPYPRDFRRGVFKFKSTSNGAKPIRLDLIRTIEHGLTGTSMPSFAAYPREDIEALADYVIYLTLRGEVERSLYRDAVADMDYGNPEQAPEDRLLAPELQQTNPEAYKKQLAAIDRYVQAAFRRWEQASENIVSVKERQDSILGSEQSQLNESVERGKQLFVGKIANCSVCHGPEGRGDGQENDFDDWTKEWTLRMGLDPNDPKKKPEIDRFVSLGAQRPRNIFPRDFTTGAFKAGSRPQDLYRRIVQGIDGTPMPGVNLVAQPSNVGLTSDQVWDIVNYVLSLSKR